MYSPRVIEARVSAAESALGFPLVRHTIEEVEARNRYLDHLRAKDPEFKLSEEDRRYVTNERTLCTLDFGYWATRYAWIKGLGNVVQRFRPNVAQRIFLDIIAEMEEAGHEIILQFIKARRLGVSTVSELVVNHRVQFFPNVTAIVGSVDPDESDKMSKMLTFSMERQPFWLRPKSRYFGDEIGPAEKGAFKKGEFYEFSNNSRLDVQHGTQTKDFGRGNDPSVWHLSELAKYENPEGKIDGGLLRAAIPHPLNFGVFEGTCEGDTGWWFDKYHYNKKYYGREGYGARMRPTFLPWFVGSDIYPTETWLRSNGWDAIRDAWRPARETAKHAEKCERFVRSSPHLAKHLGADWRMPREQQYFYESSIREYREQGNLHLWFSEMASDDVEIWQSREHSIFDAELRLRYRNACEDPVAVFAIRGESVPEKFWPRRSEIDFEFKFPGLRHCPLGKIVKSSRDGAVVLQVTAEFNRTLPPFVFELVPLKFRGYSEIDPLGKLFVWEWPEREAAYGVGFDTGDGLGERRSNNTVAEVMRRGDRERNDAQVAEFASPDISGTAMWPFGLAVGAFFSVLRGGKIRLPKAVPEVNREGGRELRDHLIKRGWPASSMHVELLRSATRRKNATPTIGLNLNAVNRERILQWGYDGISNDYLEINSPWFVGEMDTFVKRDDGTWGAAKGKLDDRILALSEVFYSLYEHETRNAGPNPFIERERQMSDEVKYPVHRDEQAFFSGYGGNLERW
ncbi:MAG: hypothetical protein M3416_01335 [Acidobacteriota bacterium]|nr:hypothetical protein [Acidobacteriota bacterium]